MELPVNIGDTAKDNISGYQGFVTMLVWPFQGQPQAVIVPTGTDEKGHPHDGHQFDLNQIQVLEKCENPTEFTEPKFHIGQQVKDKLTPFKGTVIAQILYQNGCWRYNVQPNKLGKSKLPAEYKTLDSDRLAPAQGKAVPTDATPPTKRTGGPACTAQSTHMLPKLAANTNTPTDRGTGYDGDLPRPTKV
jgi:hypothetical protein